MRRSEGILIDYCDPVVGGLAGVIAPPLGELFSETTDNAVAILLSYGPRLLAGSSEDREDEYMPAVPTRAHKRSSGFRSTESEMHFRALPSYEDRGCGASLFHPPRLPSPLLSP